MRRIQKWMSTNFYTPQPKQTHDCSTSCCFGVTNQSGPPQPSHTWLFRSVKEAQETSPKPPTMRLSIWHSELPESNSRKTQDKNFNPRNAFQNRPTRTLSVLNKFFHHQYPTNLTWPNSAWLFSQAPSTLSSLLCKTMLCGKRWSVYLHCRPWLSKLLHATLGTYTKLLQSKGFFFPSISPNLLDSLQ